MPLRGEESRGKSFKKISLFDESLLGTIGTESKDGKHVIMY